MRTKPFLSVLPFPLAYHLLLLLMAAFAGTTVATATAQTAGPTITSVRLDGTNVVVTAQAPEGIRRVTLECRERFGRGTWEPRVVARVDGAGGPVTFRLPRSRETEMMRVRAETTEPLPASFYSGTNQFYEMSAGAGSPTWDTLGLPDARNAPPTETLREVVESDIWKIRGQTLYFFNQLRGLQAIDLTEPDAPRVRGTIELPAVGEDMYVLGEKHLILLARNGCSYNESEAVVAVDNGASPAITARLPVPGYIQESRLVGTALYVASSAYRPVENGGNSTWEWGTLVSAFDLADPDAPVIRNTLWFAGYGNVVSATDRLLFVVTQDPTNWWQSIVRSVDITSPDGTMRAYESIRTAGRVPDKFKLNWEDGILTSISEDWRTVSGRRVTTMVETFRLPDPRTAGPVGVVKLGDLEVGRGEQLHATRFDGERLYLVTFFRIDPLWVIDLSNPASPRLAGSVDVPGWSTFIQPLGNRLVTIGVESNRVAVSLFNVANPAAPVLSDRVRLGQNYSYSEANWDEKAFSVLPDAGLILVPFSGDTTNGYASSVQLIDLNAGSLAARGVIQQQFQPRRATMYSNRILSVSGWELLSVDAVDRDHPVVRSTLTLAWPVDRVFLHGDFLVELGGAGARGWWGTSDQPVMRVTPANSPNDILSQTGLTALPVLGATVRDSRLYVAQGRQSWYYGPVVFDGSDADGTKPPASKLLLTVFDLGALPAVRKLGEVEASLDGSGFNGDLQALWPKPDLLVLVGGGGFSWWWPCLSCPVPLAMDARLIWRWPPFSSGGGQLVAFDVSDSTTPRFASEVNLGTNNWWNFSPAFTANGLVYLSHQVSTYFVIPTAAEPDGVAAPNSLPAGTWTARSFLDVVDFADAKQPVVRQPVNIPGRLDGISHQGSLLYTVGTHWTTNPATAWLEYLDASAYDDVSAHLVDSLALPTAWPHPVLVSGTNVFIGWPDDGGTGTVGVGVGGLAGADAQAEAAHSLQTWFVSEAGKFTRSGRVMLKNAVSSLADFSGLLAAQQTDNMLTLFDASDGSALRRVGEGRPAGCQWYDLAHADGALGRGLWLPLGAFGVARLPAQP